MFKLTVDIFKVFLNQANYFGVEAERLRSVKNIVWLSLKSYKVNAIEQKNLEDDHGCDDLYITSAGIASSGSKKIEKQNNGV